MSAPHHPLLPSMGPKPSGAEIALGLIHMIIGLIGFAIGGSLLILWPAVAEALFRVPLIQLWPVFLLICIGLLGPSLVGGLSLLQGHRRGRPILLVVSMLLLPLVPVGTALGLWGLVTLGRRRGPARVALGPAAAAFQANRQEYEGDPGAIWSCRHLAPIEQASRRAGLRLTPVSDRAVLVLDPVFVPSLERLIEPGSPVRLFEVNAPDRSPRDPARPMLHCTECRSSLLFEDAGGVARTG